MDSAGVWKGTTDLNEKRRAWIGRFIDFIDFLDYHIYEFGDRGGTEFWRNQNAYRTNLIEIFDQVLIPASKGKTIVVGETGCPTENFLCWDGSTATFTEQQQADYLRLFGEESKKRGIFVTVFKLFDPPGETHRFGLFRALVTGSMNTPKMAEGLVRDYLTIGDITDLVTLQSTPVQIAFTVNGIQYPSGTTLQVPRGSVLNVSVPAEVLI